VSRSRIVALVVGAIVIGLGALVTRPGCQEPPPLVPVVAPAPVEAGPAEAPAPVELI
jgi:hypothetical protein